MEKRVEDKDNYGMEKQVEVKDEITAESPLIVFFGRHLQGDDVLLNTICVLVLLSHASL